MMTIFVCVSLMLLAAAPVYPAAQQVREESIQRLQREIPLDEFRHQTLNAHNNRRRRHGVPDLTLSGNLNNVAQNYAQHLINTNSFQHSKSGFGENLAEWSSSAGVPQITGDQVTEMWYSEISKHNFNGEFNHETGHFTQLVWKNSREVGVGRATDGRGKVVIVANYNPPGNVIGQFRQNVFPPK